MALVQTFRMPFATTTFRRGQRVWVAYLSGNLAAECVGRYQGRGRYVRAWVNWERSSRAAPMLETFDVADDFIERHGLWRVGP